MTGDLTCRELVELVTEYLGGTLSAAEAARFEFHLSRCEGCSAYLEQMRMTIAVSGRLSEESLSRGARRDLLKAFRHWKRSGAVL